LERYRYSSYSLQDLKTESCGEVPLLILFIEGFKNFGVLRVPAMGIGTDTYQESWTHVVTTYQCCGAGGASF
jgi:hypothetical protein